MAEASIMAATHATAIDDVLLGEAFEKVRYGERKESTDLRRTARHEAGHALAMCLTGNVPIYVTTVGRGAFGGYAAPDDSHDRGSMTLPQLEDLICQLVAGREAERFFYGERDGISTGPGSDLERATALAEAMVCDYGMAKEIGFIRMDRNKPIPDVLADRCHAAAKTIIEKQAQRAAALLASHSGTLASIVEVLETEGRLTRDELSRLLTPEERALIKESP
jgi:cell division protease FtsH